MKYIFPAILILFVIISSCKPPEKNDLTPKKNHVVIQDFYRGKLHKIDTTHLTIRRNDSIDFHLFGLEKDTIEGYEIIKGFPFEFNRTNGLQILIDKNPLKFITEKEYTLKNRTLKIKKYYYDNPETIDEEGYFYFTKDRVIAFKLKHRSLIKLYRYDNSEIYEVLIKDTLNFFNK